MKSNKCEECRFFETINGRHAPAGKCRRHSPRPGMSPSWPEVSPDDWCGEWLPDPETLP